MPEYTILNYRAFCLSSDKPYLIALGTRTDSNKPFDAGWAWFMPDDEMLPPPIIDSTGRINLYYRQNQFPVILEFLRTEKPVQLFFNTGNEAGLRSSGSDGVNEEECLQALSSRPGSTSLAME